uniref:Wall-associated receptor kinase-like 14 n=1 Tax=Anthurium amnicola TaxID=1678845 RepID=A0A1D1YHU9_9ARAE
MLAAHQILLFLLLLFALLSAGLPSPSAPPACNRTCGAAGEVPFPFGFSAGCPIHLNCSSGDKYPFLIGGFHVRKVNVSSHSLLVEVPLSCNRSIAEADLFFGTSYSMTASSSLLLQNCTGNSSATACLFSSWIKSQPRYPLSCEPGSENISCSVVRPDDVTVPGGELPPRFSKDYIGAIGCSKLFTAVAFSGDRASDVPSIEFGTVELGWSLGDNCTLCHKNASCSSVSRRVIGPGHQWYEKSVVCRCKNGFDGDGFTGGTGCTKKVANGGCNPSKYMSGNCGGKTRVAVLIGGVVAGAVFMATLGLLCYFFRRCSTFSRLEKDTKRLLSEASCTVPLHPFKEIEKATNGFSEENRLGTGAYGTVYVGKLHNNELVAVKRIRHRDTDGIEQVMNEIKLLSSVSHPNLVRLLGCCIDRGEQILVYEYMPNGTLSHHLQREHCSPGLPWTVRLTIAAETAKAIAHLHSSIRPPIYHRDIKSSNILLNYNFNSKVADFGLSRMIVTESSHISTAPQGTPGYLDPQYHQNFHLSDKSDVYSFGVVLVEIITALKVVDFSRAQGEVNLAALAIDKIGKGCVEDIIDPFLEPHRDAWTVSSIHKVAELAFRCLAFHRDMRPSMKEVADELEQIRLSGWVPSDENIFMSSASSLCSSPSNGSEKSRGTSKSKRLVSTNTMDEIKVNSPVSVQDPWYSEQSSPSTNSLLGNVVQ